MKTFSLGKPWGPISHQKSISWGIFDRFEPISQKKFLLKENIEEKYWRKVKHVQKPQIIIFSPKIWIITCFQMKNSLPKFEKNRWPKVIKVKKLRGIAEIIWWKNIYNFELSWYSIMSYRLVVYCQPGGTRPYAIIIIYSLFLYHHHLLHLLLELEVLHRMYDL